MDKWIRTFHSKHFTKRCQFEASLSKSLTTHQKFVPKFQIWVFWKMGLLNHESSPIRNWSENFCVHQTCLFGFRRNISWTVTWRVWSRVFQRDIAKMWKFLPSGNFKILPQRNFLVLGCKNSIEWIQITVHFHAYVQQKFLPTGSFKNFTPLTKQKNPTLDPKIDSNSLPISK